MELLLLLVERQGELVSREVIAVGVGGGEGGGVVDHSINTAVGKVRQVLRDDPEKPRFVETVVGKGYRFAAPVICSNGGSNRGVQVESARTTAQATSEPADQPAESRFVLRRWRMVVGATAVLALIAAIAVWYRARSLKPAAQPAIKSLAVLPLKNLSSEPGQEYLADGMTEELIGRLTGIHDLRVISRTSSMQFKDSKLSVPEIAKALNVDVVVEGSVMREGDHIRIHAQLIRGATDEHFWSAIYDRDLRDVLALQSDVAQAISEKVRVTFNG